MDGMTLLPDLYRYADEAVAADRFRDRDEVAAAGLKLLPQAETAVSASVNRLSRPIGTARSFLTT